MRVAFFFEGMEEKIKERLLKGLRSLQARIDKFQRDKVKRKELMDRLRESEEFNSNLLNSSPNPITVINPDTSIKYVNSALEELTGFSSQELIGRKAPYPWWTKETLHKTSEDFSKTIKEGARRVDELFKRKNGERLWVEITSVPISSNGKFKYYLSNWVDITERKTVEEALRKAEEKYRAQFEGALDAIFLADGETGILIDCNLAALKLVAREKSELIGKHQRILHPPERIEGGFSRTFKQHLAEKEGQILETQVISKKGEIKDVAIKASLYEIRGRKILQGIFRDITERKKAEEALQVSEERYRAIFEQAADSIVLIDTETGRLVEFNDRAHESLGYTREEFKSLKIFDFEVIESAEEVSKHIKKIVREGSGIFETKHRTKRGEIRDVLISTRAFSINGRAYALGIWRDITERKKTEEELEKLNQELLKSNRKLRQLTLKDSHTGLYNHRYLGEVIEVEFDRAKRYEHSLSLIMLDIDYFKSINDVYGHPFGDLVLKQLARMLKRMVRRYDIVIRFGGEEFIIISPRINRSQALTLALRLLDSANLHNFGNKKHDLELKLSIAVASYPEDKMVKGMGLIELTDRILNKVKEDGGNRVYSSIDFGKVKDTLLEKSEDLSEMRFLREKITKLSKRGHQSLVEAVFAFAKTIKLKDRYTGEHVKRIVHYATEIARRLSLPKDEIERIREASILHDLGKIGIGERVLLKKTKLNKQEFEEIKKHPQIGVDIIRPIQILHNIIPLILHHHERWDGKGYPEGLKREEIPLGARIVAIADVYQALISTRPYRQAYSEDEAIDIIKKGAGTQFDPGVVSVFLMILQK